MRVIFLFALIILLTHCNTKSASYSNAFDTIFDSVFKASEPGGAVLIAKDGKVIYEKGAIRFITIYPRGYNDSPTGEHIHFRTKARGYSGGGTDLSFWDYQQKQLDYKNPVVTKVYLETLEEKNGELFGKAILYMKKN